MKRIFLLAISILLVFAYLSVAQEVKSTHLTNLLSMRNRTTVVSFLDVGNAERVDSATYTFSIAFPRESKIKSALAEIALSNELFVNLPGTYGGRLFLNAPESREIMKDLVLTDSIQTNQNKFIRQYWVSYAGMGLWEGVINCYLKEGEKYLVVSLVQDESLGKPGEQDNFGNVTAESMRMRMLKSLTDSTSVTLQSFSKLVASIKITN